MESSTEIFIKMKSILLNKIIGQILRQIVFLLFVLLLGISGTISMSHAASGPSVPVPELVCPKPPADGWLNKRSSLPESSTNDKRLPSVQVVSLGYQVQLFDGNPLFFPDNEGAWNSGTVYPTLQDPHFLDELSFEQLQSLTTERDGVAADGVSQLLLTMTASMAGKFRAGTTTGDPKIDGKLWLLRDGKTCETEEGHIAFAIYTAPNNFGRGTGMRPPGDNERLGGAEMRDVTVGISFRPEGHKKRLPPKKTKIKIVRPPLVLVHGLLDTPVGAWLTAANIGKTFTHYVQNAGFIPFLVDYQSTNGAYGMGMPDNSSFEDNRFVVWGGSVDRGFMGSNASDLPQTVKNPDTGEKAYRGGIRHALNYYRNNLNVAVTQADVIGHSMGGVLARVYASDESAFSQATDVCEPTPVPYNPQYRRLDNFGQGDINRLITIDTPHHGSGQIAIYELLTEKEIENEDWGSWFFRTGAKYYANYMEAASTKTKAMQDLKLESCALKRIGVTEVPSHVVAAGTREYRAHDSLYDQELSYLKALDALAALFYWFPDNLEELFTIIEEDWRGGLPEDTKQAYRDLINWGYEPWMERWNEEEGPDKKTWVPYTVLEPLRDLMFRFDENDSTVRLDSQLAGLKVGSRHVTYVALEKGADIELSVLHRYAQRMLKLQLSVVNTLKSDEDRFAPELPPAGQFMPGGEPVNPTFDFLLDGSYAKKWSGMDFRHADAIMDLTQNAHEKCKGDKNCKVIIMSRPVNPDATELIIFGAATKSMNIKGKSSNWGPQKGYIPINQRYSKLWNTGRGKIAKFNKKTKALLKAKGEPLVISRQLEHRWPRCADDDTTCLQSQRIYSVWYDDEKSQPDAMKSIYLCKTDSSKTLDQSKPCDCGTEWYDWNTAGSDAAPKFTLANEPGGKLTPPVCKRLSPLEVLADNTHKDKPFLTADYDLLTTAFYCPEGKSSIHPGCKGLVKLEDKSLPEPDRCSKSRLPLEEAFQKLWEPHNPRPCFDPQTGLIADAQEDLVDDINKAVQATGYTGGNVTHHGPETNFFESPYVDYPITVFDPDGPDGKPIILSIRKGPKGFRDVYLKRYYERKIRQRYWLYPNTFDTGNWKWELRGSPEEISEFRGWKYADDPSLKIKDTVEELPPPDCVKKEIERLNKLKGGEPADEVPDVPECQQVVR